MNPADNYVRNAGESYVMRAVKQKQALSKEAFHTTYGDTFKNVDTQKCSPLITEYHQYYNNYPDPSEDRSPYILARDGVEPKYRKPFRREEVPPTPQQDMLMNQDKSRFEDWTLKRDDYMEPLPRRDYISRERDPPMMDPRDEFRRYQREDTPARYAGHRHQEGQGHQGQGQGYGHEYDQQQEQVPEDGQKVFCNKCFKSDCCMNRLTCSHQYCDDCMANIPVQDRQFRDSIRWHYCCEVCQKLTSDPKLMRVDPRGRRLLRYHDVNTFNPANQPQ